MAQDPWSERLGALLGVLDPTVNPRQAIERAYQVVQPWQAIVGVWFHARPGHFIPPGISAAGQAIPDAEDLVAACGPRSAPLLGAAAPTVGRLVRDGNVTIAEILVTHHDQSEAATILADVLARWCTDRLRVQLEGSELAEENALLRTALAPTVGEHDIRTVSGVMQALIRSAIRAAVSTATVLIQGETGTGKELLARLIHSRSPRALKPMVAVNIAALAPSLLESELFGHARGAFTGADQERRGLFEIADGGTLFLDEIGELGPEAQVRLLRVLQERTLHRVGEHRAVPIDVRVVAATHRDLPKEVERGAFREDLYYRLNVVNLHVPPLRRRTEDIPLLVSHFLDHFGRENRKLVDRIPREVMELLCSYPWPGNIRELENCLQRAVVLAVGRDFTPDLVPAPIRAYATRRDDPPQPASAPPPAIPTPELALRSAVERYLAEIGGDLTHLIERVEITAMSWALIREQGVKLHAARRLGINRVTLDRKLHGLGMAVERTTVLRPVQGPD